MVDEPWRSSASRDLVARRYLGEAERAEYAALTPKAQRDWLLGRIAAKDAVRDCLWQQGRGPIFPLEVRVANDGAGAPSSRCPTAGRLPCRWRTAPAWRWPPSPTDGDAGIDVEVVEPRSATFAAHVA